MFELLWVFDWVQYYLMRFYRVKTVCFSWEIYYYLSFNVYQLLLSKSLAVKIGLNLGCGVSYWVCFLYLLSYFIGQLISSFSLITNILTKYSRLSSSPSMLPNTFSSSLFFTSTLIKLAIDIMPHKFSMICVTSHCQLYNNLIPSYKFSV